MCACLPICGDKQVPQIITVCAKGLIIDLSGSLHFKLCCTVKALSYKKTKTTKLEVQHNFALDIKSYKNIETSSYYELPTYVLTTQAFCWVQERVLNKP